MSKSLFVQKLSTLPCFTKINMFWALCLIDFLKAFHCSDFKTENKLQVFFYLDCLGVTPLGDRERDTDFETDCIADGGQLPNNKTTACQRQNRLHPKSFAC